MSTVVMRVINLVAFTAVIAVNGLAASGAMSGDNIGEIANRYQSLFLPANWVFGIWSLIYLMLGLCMVHQALPLATARRAVERMGWWWVATCALNIAWISLFSFAQFGLALFVIVVLLVALIVIGERVRLGDLSPEESTRFGVALPGRAGRIDWVDRAFLRWPFDIYLAWISVAVISNSFQYAHVIGFGGLGLSETTWSITMMFIATMLGAWLAWSRGMWIFPLVVAWAVYGIGQRYADLLVISVTANSIAVGGVALGLMSWVMGNSLRRYGAVA